MQTKNGQPLTVGGFFAVSPKTDCPHEASLNFPEILTNLLNKDFKNTPCALCDVTQENWMCLECYSLGCSRYFNSHMMHHNQTTGHKIALSFSDASVWCYACDSYITSNQFNKLAKEFSSLKFPSLTNQGSPDIDALAQVLSNLKTNSNQQKDFTRQNLIDGLKNKTFKSIVMMTGAGISVSAGIPDFRSPGTGVYNNLASYNLPNPEAAFDIDYFKQKPETYYKISKDIFKHKPTPVISHHFIKVLDDEGLLFYSLTQNIDGLEIEAGVNPEKVVEAHGHFRSAHCLKCNAEKPIDVFLQHVEEEKVYVCECGGLVKPDIIFFGENLPESFFMAAGRIKEADLVIIMGTSLKVAPFSLFVNDISRETPLVYINKENTKIFRDNFLFLQGDIDTQLQELVKDLGWEEKLGKVKAKDE